MRSVTAVTLAVLVVLSAVPATGQSTAGDGRITDVSYAGDVVTSADNQTVVWVSSDHQFEVTIESSDGLENASVCAAMDAAAAEDALACNSTTVPAGTAHGVTVTVPDWPANQTGTQDVQFRLSTPNSSGVMDESVLSVTVLDEDGDLDGDGLSNQEEVSVGADFRANDTDGDGLDDGAEVHAYGSSPTNRDTDNDGLDDGAEINEYGTDPTVADTDDDGLQDAREVDVGTNPEREDSDGDGLLDGAEVHTHDTNATKADTDGDGLDDGTEVNEENTNPTRQDTDGDGLTDNLEVATYDTDPTEVDTDGDGLEDGQEVHEYHTDPTLADTDGDGLEDGVEVNQYGTDPTSSDTDRDGLDDGAEINQFGTDPTAVDTDGDGVLDPQEVERVGQLSSPQMVAFGAVVVVGFVIFVYWLVWRRLFGRELPLRNRYGLSEASTDPAGESTENDTLQALPNRERVLELLDEHDGQMQQSDVVAETDWSKSKVSRVLSEMEADGQIAKISLGRENLITRPEDRPPETRHPIDE